MKQKQKPSFEIKWLYLQVKQESCYATFFFIYILKIQNDMKYKNQV